MTCYPKRSQGLSYHSKQSLWQFDLTAKRISYYCLLLFHNLLMQAKQKSQALLLNELTNFDPERKTVSLPLEFEFLPVEILSKEFTRLNNNHAYRIHYLGPRHINTLTLHKKYAYSDKQQEDYAALVQNAKANRYKIDARKIVESYSLQEKLRGNSYYKSGLFYRAFQGMNPYLGEGEWIFNSLFQSGNLDCAIKVADCQFDLFLRVDANTKGHVQWFYFSVKNGSRKQKLKMNLCNLSKAKSLYDAGLQPYVFSKEAHRASGVGWCQAGKNLGMSRKELRYQFLQEKVPAHMMQYYCLELQYKFEYQNDEVFFAYCIPFTFSRLLNQIELLPTQWVRKSILGKSLSGIDIPLLHITNHQITKEKKNILVTGRWHPGESNSSHMLQGFIDFLTSPAREAAELRNRANFIIVPMANPDGVVCGNTRTSLAGRDLNRQFLVANKELYPEVSLVKELARNLQSRYGLFMYLDFHGHSRKKNTFFYGPAYSIHEPNYYKSRIFPKLVEKVDSNFRFHSCSFSIQEEKKQTARAIMFEQLKVAFSYTIQTSIGSFYDCQAMKTQKFNEIEYRTIGTSILQGLSKFLVGFEEYEQILKERRASRQKRRPPTAGKHTFTEHPVGTNDEQEMVSYFKRGQPLKIVYNDQSLFGSLIQELKSTKHNNYIKEVDEDFDSDAHDEAQQFQASKMKEFHNLLSDAARKDAFKSSGKNSKQNQRGIKSSRESQRNNNFEQDLAQELLFLQELQEVNKTVPPPNRQQPRQLKKPSTVSEIKRSLKINRGLLPLSNQGKTVPTMQPSEMTTIHHKKQMKKRVSESEIANERLSYFGEFKIFSDKNQNELSQTKHYQRNSIFTREKSRGTNKSAQVDYKFMSQSFLDTANRTAYSSKLAPPKTNNYEFKFDEIQTAVVAKQRLKEYLRTKITKANRNSVIGPASFYGVRQNINQKKNNKQRFAENERLQRDSIKIIKFT